MYFMVLIFESHLDELTSWESRDGVEELDNFKVAATTFEQCGLLCESISAVITVFPVLFFQSALFLVTISWIFSNEHHTWTPPCSLDRGANTLTRLAMSGISSSSCFVRLRAPILLIQVRVTCNEVINIYTPSCFSCKGPNG